MSRLEPNVRYQAHLRTSSPDPDAGLRGLDHYERRLPKWRYQLRQWLIPMVRRETAILAALQERYRAPWLDSYFALTANLGTHTFFMTALPICFWCGYPNAATALIHMLAAGVYLTGYAKDLVCLPRPLSPPLQRITMSGSAALEYGFPSTHTTNSVSVTLYCLYQLWQAQDQYSPLVYGLLVAACLCYAASISIGRLYCGMHGFFDVGFAAVLGTLIAAAVVLYGPSYDFWIISDGWIRPGITVLVLLLAVRFHPEPADNCPCFDDSVAFMGVVMGISSGTWSYAHHLPNSDGPATSLDQMFDYSVRDPFKVLARMVVGISLIFAWRATMKPLLLRGLPPIFRLVDHYGVRIPRRYFLQSRDYGTVPPLRQDDKVLPRASDIPAMLSDISRRKRTISVGPQSEADAREMIANREQLRRDNRSTTAPKTRNSRSKSPTTPSIDAHVVMTPEESPESASYLAVKRNEESITKPSLQVNTAAKLLTPPSSEAGASSDEGREDEKNDRVMFSILEKPRVRYDVEVITKLIVYAGIAWLTVEGNPLIFYHLGVE